MIKRKTESKLLGRKEEGERKIKKGNKRKLLAHI